MNLNYYFLISEYTVNYVICEFYNLLSYMKHINTFVSKSKCIEIIYRHNKRYKYYKYIIIIHGSMIILYAYFYLNAEHYLIQKTDDKLL